MNYYQSQYLQQVKVAAEECGKTLAVHLPPQVRYREGRGDYGSHESDPPDYPSHAQDYGTDEYLDDGSHRSDPPDCSRPRVTVIDFPYQVVIRVLNPIVEADEEGERKAFALKVW